MSVKGRERDGEGYYERAALAKLALHVYVTPKCLNELLHDR